MAGPDRLLFIDFEASGLGEAAFPVELGWAWVNGGSGSRLIRPALTWELASWDDEAAALHGLSLARLVSEGHQARDVADYLVALISDATTPITLVSDAPDYDQRWLDLLMLETPRELRVRLTDDRWLRRERFGLAGDDGQPFTEIEQTHRAEPDAVALRDRWVRLLRAEGC